MVISLCSAKCLLAGFCFAIYKDNAKKISDFSKGILSLQDQNSSAFVLLIIAIKLMYAYCANQHHVKNGREEECDRCRRHLR